VERVGIVLLLCTALLVGGAGPALAKSADELTRESADALAALRANNVGAETLAQKAKGILVFPGIWKAGFMFGGQVGEGVLFERGTPVDYYNSVAASYGLQAGVQKYGYALFFMDDASLEYLRKSAGFEIGVGPSVVVVEEGFGKSLTTTTAHSGIYAFIFDQKGLMAGIGIQGSKITRISK
jgi:lipid-binding SYLF domain-containing protein